MTEENKKKFERLLMAFAFLPLEKQVNLFREAVRIVHEERKKRPRLRWLIQSVNDWAIVTFPSGNVSGTLERNNVWYLTHKFGEENAKGRRR